MLNDVSWMLWGRKLKCYNRCCYIAQKRNLLKNDLTCWKLFLPFCDCYVKVSTISATKPPLPTNYISHTHTMGVNFIQKVEERRKSRNCMMTYSFEFYNYFNCSHLLKSHYRMKPVMYMLALSLSSFILWLWEKSFISCKFFK